MSPTRRFAVIGGGIAGLTAAARLAKAGHEVTLFEGSDSVGGKAQVVTSGGLTLDTGPTLLTLPDVVKATFEEVGALDLMPRFHRLELQTHYRFADGPDFLCWEDLDRASDSANALLEGEGARLRDFYREAEKIFQAAGAPFLEGPYESMAGYLARVFKSGLTNVMTGVKLSSLDSLAAKHFQSPQLRQFAGRFATYTGASPYESSAAFAMIAHIERAFGVHHVQGGMGSIVVALEAAARRNGATIRLGSPATWKRGEKIFEVTSPQGVDFFDSVIVNADPLASVGRSDEALAMSGYVLLVEAGARVSLPHHLILFSRDYRREFAQLFSGEVPEDPTVYVCHPAATDQTMAAPGTSGLFVMVNAPSFSQQQSMTDIEAAWKDHAGHLQEFLLGKLRAFSPEMKGVSLKVIAERTPVDLARRGAPGGSIYGFLPHGKFGPFRRPMMRGQTPGLFYAGGGTHPGGGVPMVMLSGRFAAGMAQQFIEGHA